MRHGRLGPPRLRIALAGVLALALAGSAARANASRVASALRPSSQALAPSGQRPTPGQRAKGPDAFFQRHHGRLVFPVEGVIAVGFGPIVDLRSGTRTAHNGLDIRAAPDTPVCAVAPGRIVHAASLTGYGALLIVEHSDGYHSIYARLSSIERAVGERVVQGEVIGAVGKTDSKKAPGLHFELRRHGLPLDPGDWFARP